MLSINIETSDLCSTEVHLYSLACKKQTPYEEAQQFIVEPTAIALVGKTLHLVNQLYMMRTVSGYMLCSRQAINQLKVSIELWLKVSSSSSNHLVKHKR